MKAVSIYSALLGQKKLKEQFVEDLRNLLHRDNKLCMIPGKLSFVKYSELRTWSIRQIAKKGELSEEDQALIDKVNHMLLTLNTDFESVIRMLYSFRRGVKAGIRVYDYSKNYEWTNKDGNEKLSTHNLPKAHFRWNWRRYTLSEESVKRITEFVDNILKS
jgi:hypothetical protein